MKEPIHTLTEHLFRQESGKMLSVLVRFFGLKHRDLAEDIVQDTLLAAYETWRIKGAPENPRAWLYRAAKNKTVDALRRQSVFESKIQAALVKASATEELIEQLFLDDEISDAQLRMMFWCCHPALSPDAQIALMLKSLCGMSAKEIAIGFMQQEDTVARRIHRAKEKLRELEPDIHTSSGSQASATDTVLHALYLLYNEGYKSATSVEVIRQDLCMEAIRLTLILANHSEFASPKVFALLALMAFQSARQPARLTEHGELVPLDEQDRSKWIRELIQVGYAYFSKANEATELSTYHIEAGIASYHTSAPTFQQTNWQAIVQAYHFLYQLSPNKAVAFNRAIAIGYASGAESGIKALEDPLVDQNQAVWHIAMADFLVKLSRAAEAKIHYGTALEYDLLAPERVLVIKKRNRITSQ